MKFYFWQNVISIHQSAFLKALSREHHVHLVVGSKIGESRKKEGWSVPELDSVDIVVSPTETQMSRAVSIPGAYHIFSGIDAFPMVYNAFKKAVANRCNITVMAEPYNWLGIRGWLRMMKYRMLFMRYGKYISHFFTTGNQGIKCFSRSGMPMDKLHQWGYFTEAKPQVQISDETAQYAQLCGSGENTNCATVSNMVSSETPIVLSGEKKVRILYVGRLDLNKNIRLIFNAYEHIKDCIEQFVIVGSGYLDGEVSQFASRYDNVKYVGRVPNQYVPLIMRTCDYLILPSHYDGWGAVVNEALMQGTRVICSDACGASVLLDSRTRGESFKSNDAIDFSRILLRWLARGPLSENERCEIAEWAANHISGAVAADYFTRILKGDSIKAPWL